MISILILNVSDITFLVTRTKVKYYVLFNVSDLNESLVNLLLERDELHMAKDSMLVDIEDLKHVTRISY